MAKLVGIYKPYPGSDVRCRKCWKKPELVFTIHSMDDKGNLKFYHYCLEHAPKIWVKYMRTRLKSFVLGE